MAELDQEKIRIVAHQLWERDGSPEGKADDYWHAAVKLLSDEGAAENPEEEPVEVMPVLPIPPVHG